jgi:exopolysaccharide production protein ExoQ
LIPLIAYYTTLGLIIWLCVRDVKRRDGVSGATWLVVMWFLIFASRPVSSWLQGGRLSQQSADGYLDGSPMDAVIFFGLIVAGAAVLVRRSVQWSALISRNRWMFVFFFYCMVSVVWSDYPFVAFKRWFKDFGNVILLAVLLTEEKPVEAIKAVFVRCGIILVPLSFVLIRYYPEIGRIYTGWNRNDLMYVGVAAHKNTLGALLLVSAAALIWDLTSRTNPELRADRLFRRGRMLVLAMSIWLLLITDSATSLLCTLIFTGIYFGTKIKFLKRRLPRVELYAIAIGTLWFTLDSTLGLSELVIVNFLGRDMELTTRTEAWDLVLSAGINPLLGAGFKSFWAGERMVELWKVLPHIVQSHNGYVETYLNGGLLGVIFLAIMLLTGFARVKRDLVQGSEFARIRFTFWVITLFYNFSEAAFNQLSLLWCVTLLVVAETPVPMTSEQTVDSPAAAAARRPGPPVPHRFVLRPPAHGPLPR